MGGNLVTQIIRYRSQSVLDLSGDCDYRANYGLDMTFSYFSKGGNKICFLSFYLVKADSFKDPSSYIASIAASNEERGLSEMSSM